MSFVVLTGWTARLCSLNHFRIITLVAWVFCLLETFFYGFKLNILDVELLLEVWDDHLDCLALVEEHCPVESAFALLFRFALSAACQLDLAH